MKDREVMNMKYCPNCGKELADMAVMCPGCGVMLNNTPATKEQQPGKSSPAAIILGILGFIFAWLFALIGHVLSIIGIVLGAKEIKRSGKALGLVLSIVAEVCCVISSLIGIVMALSIF